MTSRGSLRVAAAGAQALVQDRGRPGHAAVGVSGSGAADRACLDAVNRLLGNRPEAAAVEVLLGGLELEVGDRGVWCCVTGAPVEVRVDGRGVGWHHVFAAPAGSRIRLGRPQRGLRSYLGVRGGVGGDRARAVLGSRSHDTLAGLGPAPLVVDDVLEVGRDACDDWWPVDVQRPPRLLATPEETVLVRAVAGPHEDRCADLGRLTTQSWHVDAASDRIGTRLDGGTLQAVGGAQLPSEGVRRGAVQLPPSGRPLVFGPDHPVTGGYPVVAVVLDADVDLLAQARPGQAVRFRLTPTVP